MRRRNFITLLGGAAMRSKTEPRPTIGGRTPWQHGKNGFGLKSGKVAAFNTFQAQSP
jgi:hypothetical protein